MAVKSILEIDVQDDKFQEFNRLFERYRESVKELPGDWGAAAQATDGAAAAFDALTKKAVAGIATGRMDAAAKAAAAAIVKRTDAEAASRSEKAFRDSLTRQQRFMLGLKDVDKAASKIADTIGKGWGSATAKVAKDWAGLARSTRGVASHITSATTSLLKWTSLTGVFSALVGAGGLFGIDRLAEGVASQRRANMGTGVGYGQQRAFSMDYGRFVDADGMLANVSGALSDKTSRGYVGLRGAGISDEFASTHNAADVSVEVLKRLPDIFKGVQPGLVGATAQARGLTDILSVEDIKRYLAASPEERRTQEDAYRRDSRTLDVDPATTRAWQDLTTQLGRAKSEIETTFVTGLVPLAGPIADVSKAFTDLTTAFLKSDVVKSGIEGLASGIEAAAKYVSTQEFKDDMKSFAEGIGDLAHSVRKALEWLGLIGTKKAADAANSAPGDDKTQSALAAIDGSQDHATGGQGIWHHAFNSGKHGFATARAAMNDDANYGRFKSRADGFRATSASQQANAAAIADELRKADVPDEGIAASLGTAQTESGLNPAVPENNYNRGHHGLFQWDRTRWAKVSKWITDHGGDPMDARWQTRAYIAEGRAKPGEAIYDGPQTTRGFNKLDTSKGDIGRAIEGSGDIERFGSSEEGGRGANTRSWMGHLPGSFAGQVKGDPAGLALSMQGFGEVQSAQALGHIMHAGEWCADFVNGVIEKSGGKGSANAMASSFATWGKAVQNNDVKRGDVIMENSGAGTRTHHVGLATGNVQRDKAGNVTAIEMISGNYGHMVKKNWESVNIIAGLRRGEAMDGEQTKKAVDAAVTIHRSRGAQFHRQIQSLQKRIDADAAKTNDEARSGYDRHMTNLRTEMIARGFHGDRFSFAGKRHERQVNEIMRRSREAARAEGMRRAPDGGAGDRPAPQRTSGLGGGRFQERRTPNIMVANNTGANVNVTAAAASYG